MPTNIAAPDEHDDRLLTFREICELLKIKRRTLQAWIAGGKFPRADISVGHTRRWWWSTIRRWSDRQGPGYPHR